MYRVSEGITDLTYRDLKKYWYNWLAKMYAELLSTQKHAVLSDGAVFVGLFFYVFS